MTSFLQIMKFSRRFMAEWLLIAMLTNTPLRIKSESSAQKSYSVKYSDVLPELRCPPPSSYQHLESLNESLLKNNYYSDTDIIIEVAIALFLMIIDLGIHTF